MLVPYLSIFYERKENKAMDEYCKQQKMNEEIKNIELRCQQVDESYQLKDQQKYVDFLKNYWQERNGKNENNNVNR